MRSVRRGSGPLAALARDVRGTVTAEFAVVLPAVVAVLGLVIGGVMIAADRVGLEAAASEAARLEARGDSAAANARIRAVGHRVKVSRIRGSQVLCLSLRAAPGEGLLGALSITGRGCAALSDAAAN